MLRRSRAALALSSPSSVGSTLLAVRHNSLVSRVTSALGFSNNSAESQKSAAAATTGASSSSSASPAPIFPSDVKTYLVKTKIIYKTEVPVLPSRPYTKRTPEGYYSACGAYNPFYPNVHPASEPQKPPKTVWYAHGFRFEIGQPPPRVPPEMLQSFQRTPRTSTDTTTTTSTDTTTTTSTDTTNTSSTSPADIVNVTKVEKKRYRKLSARKIADIRNAAISAGFDPVADVGLPPLPAPEPLKADIEANANEYKYYHMRQQLIEQRLKEMPEIIRVWREEKRLAKIKSRPTAPF